MYMVNNKTYKTWEEAFEAACQIALTHAQKLGYQLSEEDLEQWSYDEGTMIAPCAIEFPWSYGEDWPVIYPCK